MAKMKKTEWGYLAGIIDADGCINISVYPNQHNQALHFKPKIEICGDILLMKWLEDHIGSTQKIYKKHDFEGVPTCFTWRTAKKQLVKHILENTVKYLTTKEKEALLMLEFLRVPPPQFGEKKKECTLPVSLDNTKLIGEQQSGIKDRKDGF